MRISKNWELNGLKIIIINLKNFLEIMTILPDISKWNINNVTNMRAIFAGCNKLSLLSDNSKCNTNNVTTITAMFQECSLLTELPDIGWFTLVHIFCLIWIINN